MHTAPSPVAQQPVPRAKHPATKAVTPKLIVKKASPARKAIQRVTVVDVDSDEEEEKGDDSEPIVPIPTRKTNGITVTKRARTPSPGIFLQVLCYVIFVDV
jgi:hypothetical protein